MCHHTREPTVLSRVSCRPSHLNIDRFHQPCLIPWRTPYCHRNTAGLGRDRWGLSSLYQVAATYPLWAPDCHADWKVTRKDVNSSFPPCVCVVFLWAHFESLWATHSLPSLDGTGVLWVLTGTHRCDTPIQAGWWEHQSASSFLLWSGYWWTCWREVMKKTKSLHPSMVSGLRARATWFARHHSNINCSDCCARPAELILKQWLFAVRLELFCIRHCSCTSNCLRFNHGLHCISRFVEFERVVHVCWFNFSWDLGLLLTVTRDASDRPKTDPSSLDAPTQPLSPSRAYSPTVRVCASTSALRRAPGNSWLSALHHSWRSLPLYKHCAVWLIRFSNSAVSMTSVFHTGFTCPRSSLPSTPPWWPAAQSCQNCHHHRWLPALREHHQLLSVNTGETATSITVVMFPRRCWNHTLDCFDDFHELNLRLANILWSLCSHGTCCGQVWARGYRLTCNWCNVFADVRNFGVIVLDNNLHRSKVWAHGFDPRTFGLWATRCKVCLHCSNVLSDRIARAFLIPAISTTRVCDFSSYVITLSTHISFNSLRYSSTADNSACAESLTMINSPNDFLIRSSPAPYASRPVNDHLKLSSQPSAFELLHVTLWSFSAKQPSSPHCHRRTRWTKRECSWRNPALHGDIHNLFDDALLHSFLWNNLDRVHVLFLDPLDNLNLIHLMLYCWNVYDVLTDLSPATKCSWCWLHSWGTIASPPRSPSQSVNYFTRHLVVHPTRDLLNDSRNGLVIPPARSQRALLNPRVRALRRLERQCLPPWRTTGTRHLRTDLSCPLSVPSGMFLTKQHCCLSSPRCSWFTGLLRSVAGSLTLVLDQSIIVLLVGRLCGYFVDHVAVYGSSGTFTRSFLSACRCTRSQDRCASPCACSETQARVVSGTHMCLCLLLAMLFSCLQLALLFSCLQLALLFVFLFSVIIQTVHFTQTVSFSWSCVRSTASLRCASARSSLRLRTLFHVLRVDWWSQAPHTPLLRALRV